MSRAEIEAGVREALRRDGWYVVLRTPSGDRRIAVAEWKLDSIGPDGEVEAAILRGDGPAPLDILGRATPLGAYHPELRPES